MDSRVRAKPDMQTSQPRSGDFPYRDRAAPMPVLGPLMRAAAREIAAIDLQLCLRMADVAEVLWRDCLRHSPRHPDWPDRDRLVLSDYRALPLLKVLLHLSGYDLPLPTLAEPIAARSLTAVPTEPRLMPGLEVIPATPNQGLGQAVGMALATKLLADRFNRDGFSPITHHVYALIGNPCLLAGMSHEAGSTAGSVGLDRLIVLHVDDGHDGTLVHRVERRFQAYHWHVEAEVDGHDPGAIREAIGAARSVTDRPSLIGFRTKPDHPSPTAPTLTWKALGKLRADGDDAAAGARQVAAWQQQFSRYEQAFPDLAAEFQRRLAGQLPRQWGPEADRYIQETAQNQTAMATRQSSYHALNRYAPLLPELVGGSADLTPANKTNWQGSQPVRRGYEDGNHVHYGARELVMGAMLTGMARHGGFIPFAGTFLMFCDYARAAMRMAALNRAHGIFVFTHDSIGLGEDGPTHQPIEQLASLRLIPGMVLWRPCDALESAVAWRAAIERRDGPTCLVFTRQNVDLPVRDSGTVEAIRRGGYILWDCPGEPEAIVIATGSEVPLATQAAAVLEAEGRRIRVVSMPCTQLFESQTADYQRSVLPPHITVRVVVEAGSTVLWQHYAGPRGRILGIDRFGESAPQETLFHYFGLSVDNITAAVRDLLTAGGDRR